MTVREIYENHYKFYAEYTNGNTKYEWAASEVLDLTTYDGNLDEEFVKCFIEVVKAILDRRTYEYLE